PVTSINARRLLRSIDSVDSTDNEERVRVLGLSKRVELASKVNSQAAQKLARKMWLSTREPPDTVFVKLIRKSRTDLESNPKLVEWLRFTEAYKKQTSPPFTDKKILAILEKKM
ncbi:hypothetical protein PHYSODRAFT_265379, partial [Phytophthora sojae]